MGNRADRPRKRGCKGATPDICSHLDAAIQRCAARTGSLRVPVGLFRRGAAVAQRTVNPLVVGSNPTAGAIFLSKSLEYLEFLRAGWCAHRALGASRHPPPASTRAAIPVGIRRLSRCPFARPAHQGRDGGHESSAGSFCPNPSSDAATQARQRVRELAADHLGHVDARFSFLIRWGAR
jgi:hypothetical protein